LVFLFQFLSELTRLFQKQKNLPAGHGSITMTMKRCRYFVKIIVLFLLHCSSEKVTTIFIIPIIIMNYSNMGRWPGQDCRELKPWWWLVVIWWVVDILETSRKIANTPCPWDIQGKNVGRREVQGHVANNPTTYIQLPYVSWVPGHWASCFQSGTPPRIVLLHPEAICSYNRSYI
jgi:hypothetical protein